MEQHLSVRIDGDIMQLLDKIAQSKGLTKSDLVRLFVRRGLQGIVRRKRLLAELPVNSLPEQNPERGKTKGV